MRSVSFAGAVALAAGAAAGGRRLREGAPYRAAGLQPAADRVRAAYARAGYPQCAVTARPDFRADRASVDLRFTVVEGRLQRLGAIAVTGNGRTARRVILRELPLAPGDPLDPEALAEGKNGLYNLGLFREVRYLLPEPVSPEAPQDLVLAVRERPTGLRRLRRRLRERRELPRLRRGRRAEPLRDRARACAGRPSSARSGTGTTCSTRSPGCSTTTSRARPTSTWSAGRRPVTRCCAAA